MKERSFIFVANVIVLTVVAWSISHAQTAPTERVDVAFGNQGQTLNLWLPAIAHKRAMLLFAHGGGFKSGNKEQMDGYAKLYAQGGFVSATINYRLAPQFPFPAALNDLHDAIDWAHRNASVFGYDTNKVVLIGYSAGGNLVLMAGFDAQSSVAAIVSAAGPSDLQSLYAQATMPQLRIDLDNYLHGATFQSASPIYFAHAGAPPTLLIHGDIDDFVPIAQSLVLAQRLKDLQVPVLMKVAPGVGHEVLLPNPQLKNVLDTLTSFVIAVDQQQ